MPYNIVSATLVALVVAMKWDGTTKIRRGYLLRSWSSVRADHFECL